MVGCQGPVALHAAAAQPAHMFLEAYWKYAQCSGVPGCCRGERRWQTRVTPTGGSPRAGRHRLVPRAGAGTWAIGRGALAVCLPCAVPCEPVQPAHRLRAVGRTLCRSHRRACACPGLAAKHAEVAGAAAGTRLRPNGFRRTSAGARRRVHGPGCGMRNGRGVHVSAGGLIWHPICVAWVSLREPRERRVISWRLLGVWCRTAVSLNVSAGKARRCNGKLWMRSWRVDGAGVVDCVQ